MNINEGYMKNLSRINAGINPSWFKSWFDSSFYHQLYAHRSESEAQGFIDNLIPELQPSPQAKMLDLGCGAGRHSKYLASKGFSVTGLDLAGSSIRQAQRSTNDNLQFYQHDMRIAFGKNYFDYVFNFFTSFGYFDSTEEDHKVIHNISQIDRGYQDIDTRLNAIGAQIKRVDLGSVSYTHLTLPTNREV